ncbi:alpha/beta fold hydrolase [Nonomuraea sp. NPDC050556]|uniref:alpha/beta fold hydrolase n=1 Tax=Nonomuraea sp. NPDC050556 TaxID=3364369 RepID=UPI0037A585D6
MSRDGTRIAFERQGSGPAVILVTGNLDDGTENAPLATELAPRFTVYTYNSRGRGDSGDGLPYAMERETEDIDALIAEAGGAAHLFGISSGGALAYDAAALPPAGIARPVLVATGGGMSFYEQAGDALAAILPKAERVTVDQGHVVDARTFAPVLRRFFQVDAA